MSDFAQGLIKDLDDSLAIAGHDVILRRPFGTNLSSNDVTCRARFEGYDPQELVGEINQQDQKFILSPTQINAQQWPGFITGQDPAVDQRIPRKNDLFFTQRGKLAVQAAHGLYVDDTLVRIEGRVRGN